MGEDYKKGSFKEAPKEFKEELLRIDKVTRVTAGGRQLRFRASVVIGNNKGQVGLGIGKAGEVVIAIDKAIRDAKKNLIHFPIKNGTIPYDVKVKYNSTSVMLHPASPGTGIIAGGAIRKVLSVSGLKDVLAKRYGASNSINNARSVIKALGMIKTMNNKFMKSKTTEQAIDQSLTSDLVAVEVSKDVIENASTKTTDNKEEKPTEKVKKTFRDNTRGKKVTGKTEKNTKETKNENKDEVTQEQITEAPTE